MASQDSCMQANTLLYGSLWEGNEEVVESYMDFMGLYLGGQRW